MLNKEESKKQFCLSAGGFGQHVMLRISRNTSNERMPATLIGRQYSFCCSLRFYRKYISVGNVQVTNVSELSQCAIKLFQICSKVKQLPLTYVETSLEC